MLRHGLDHEVDVAEAPVLGGALDAAEQLLLLRVGVLLAFSRPWSTNFCSTSLSTTGMPDEAITWAISPPMVPAPTTAALAMNMARQVT